MIELSNTEASMRFINRSAVHTHALKCAKELGRTCFTRVGESFINDVQAEVEALLRKINGQFQPPVHPVVDSAEAIFVAGPLVDRARDVLNAAAARIIQSKVQRHPSVGKTLQ